MLTPMPRQDRPELHLLQLARLLRSLDQYLKTVALRTSGVAQLSTNNSSQILGTFSHGLNKSLTALLLFRASASFDVAFVGRGCNICNLVDGIQGGLTELFQRMTMLSWSVTVAQVGFLGQSVPEPACSGCQARHQLRFCGLQTAWGARGCRTECHGCTRPHTNDQTTSA